MRRYFLFAMVFIVCVSAKAQQSIANMGNLQIHAGASVGFHGNFTNTNTASLLNNGSLYCKRNIISDQASMNAGSGILYLNGSDAQSVGGSGTFKTFNLVTNNASGITLNSDLSVSGSHTFSSGIITTAVTPNFLIYEAGSSYTGADNSRHVNGWIKKVGSTDFTFPVGNASFERSIAINNLSANSVFAVKYNSSTPYTSKLQAPLTGIDPNEYWDVSKTLGGTASVSMGWDNSKVPFMNWVLTNIRVAAYDGSSWVSQGGAASGDVYTAGNITSAPVSSFTSFTFGSQSSILPLTLIQFKAKWVNNYTEVSWSTDNERDVNHFIVDCSEDGRKFYGITQQAARNSGHLEHYIAYDTRPVSDQAYYRLRSVDIDGSEQYSQVVKVTAARETGNLSLFNNPVKEKLILVAGNEFGGEFQYSIVSASGQVMQLGKVNIAKQEYTSLPLKASIKTGAYILSLMNATQSIQIKFIVQ